jgi:hypothetical protein
MWKEGPAAATAEGAAPPGVAGAAPSVEPPALLKRQ